MIERPILKVPFNDERRGDWPCPSCSNGTLQFRNKTFLTSTTRASRKASEREDFEPEWTEYVYTGVLDCSNTQCKEVVVTVGTGGVEMGYEDDGDGVYREVYESHFRPTMFVPALNLIAIPAKCPPTVAQPLRESFALFFSSPGAASNNIRIAVEELLTELRVKRFNTVGGQRRFISLHQRINLLPRKFVDLRELMLAIKWLGNAGSHGDGGSGAISADDVMDAYEMMEHILAEVYSPRSNRLAAIAKKVNKRKGPLRIKKR